MYALSVGKPYVEGRESWPEKLQAHFSPNLCELASIFSRPTKGEIAAYQADQARFALAVAGPHLLIIAVKYGDLPWVDMPFEAARVPTHSRGLPTGGPYDPIHVRSVLVDADSGLTQALRIDAVDGEFACGLRAAIWEQINTPTDFRAAADELEQIRAAYPTAELLAAHRAEESTTGRPVAGGLAPLEIHHY